MIHQTLPLRSFAYLFILSCLHGGITHADDVSISFIESQPISNIEIDGRAAHIHTQGIFVDKQHIYVTGRLENKPKRPLFLRFDRKNPASFSFIDLNVGDDRLSNAQLDHPGGFDFDGECFWIPVAKSNPSGPSAIIRIKKDLQTPFESWKPKLAFIVDDHIGAIASQSKTGLLLGANWDTKQIYEWSIDGKLLSRTERSRWAADDPNWALAVQDWKYAGVDGLNPQTVLVAGGLDKSPLRDAALPKSVVEIFDKERESIARVHVSAVDEFRGHMTNEGLCVLNGDTLCLLPADIGHDAKLYFFKISVAKKN